jgi:hypothetical protein
MEPMMALFLQIGKGELRGFGIPVKASFGGTEIRAIFPTASNREGQWRKDAAAVVLQVKSLVRFDQDVVNWTESKGSGRFRFARIYVPIRKFGNISRFPGFEIKVKVAHDDVHRLLRLVFLDECTE